MSDISTLRIFRDSAFFGHGCNIEIYVNGKVNGKIGPGNRLDLLVPPGPTTVAVVMHSCRSPDLHFQLGGNEVCELEIVTQWLAPAIFCSLLAPSKVLTVRRRDR